MRHRQTAFTSEQVRPVVWSGKLDFYQRQVIPVATTWERLWAKITHMNMIEASEVLMV